MNLSRKVASALSFAHLAGLGRGKAKAEDNDDDKKDRDHEDVDDGAKKGKADDAKPDDDDKDKKDGPDAKAEDDDPDADDKDKVYPDKDDKDSKGKKADDDSDDEKMKAARQQERARCAAIFAAPAAARNVALAAELAFNTDLSAEQATAILAKTPAGAVNPNRSAGNPRVAGTSGPEITGKQAVDSSWDRAFAKVSPPKRR